MGVESLREPQLRRLVEAGREVVARLDLHGVLATLLDAARELTGARYAALGVLDENRRELDRFLTLGVEERAREEIGALPQGRGILGELIANPRPLRIDDLGSDPRAHGFPPGHPPMRTFLGVPILVRGLAWGNLYLAEKEGGRSFDAADEAAVVVLADWAAVAIENARLYERVAGRRDAVEIERNRAERSVRGLGAMTDIARAVGGETRLDRILELIVERGRSLVEARALMILLAEGDELTIAATAGELDPGLEGSTVPVEGTVAGDVLRTRRAARLRREELEGRDLAGPATPAEAAVVVPLVFRGTAHGVLVALDRFPGGPDFRPEDERLVRSFAASAATAVATARSVEAERLRQSIESAEQERKRWARELHDQTLQALGGLRMIHSAALRSHDEEDVRGALEEGIELIDSEIDSLSALIAELRPPALDEIGLAAALRTLAERKGREGGFEADVLVRIADGGEGRLPPETESTIYRIVQEALSNAAKHADATRAEVMVERGERAVEVTVRDDGRGFDPGAVRNGFGLTGMRERVGLVGGELEIESEPGAATAVRATIPLASAKPEGAAPQRSSSPRSST